MLKIIDRFIEQPLNQLDSSKSRVFVNVFYFILKISAILVTIFGLYIVIEGLLGKTGYFSNFSDVFSTFEKARSIICFIITFSLNVLLFLIIGSILWVRADHFKKKETLSILFLLPRTLRVLGEVACVVPTIASLVSFFAILLAAIPYAPVESIISLTGGVGLSLINNFIGNAFSAIFVQNFQDYMSSLINGGIIGLFSGLAVSLGILLVTYLISEILEVFFYFLIREKRSTK